jgi:putative spermidine/putrescine transport system ATP-binding protein
MDSQGLSNQGCTVGITGVGQRFQDFVALHKVDLAIAGGEMVALLGPSGCGKSTLLRIIAGFIRQTSGTVSFDGTAVDNLGARQRGAGIVFQNYALFPHMSVRQNVAYGLVARRWSRDRMEQRVDQMLDLVHMRSFGDRLPRQLSGGQQQRIALARCLAIDPKVLLLDEPFGALDKSLRLDVQIEVKRLQRESGITTVLVTHDQEEAMSMADRIAVMNKGRIEQVASPTAIYDAPETLFVSQFVGTSNVLPGTLIDTDADGATVRLADGSVIRTALPPAAVKDAAVQVSVRPEQLELRPEGGQGMRGVIKAVMPLGPQVIYEVALAGQLAVKIAQARAPDQPLLLPGASAVVAPVSSRACRVLMS